MAWAERFGGRTFLLAALANFAHSLAFHSYLHLPGFLQGLGADEFVIGQIMAVAFLTAIMCRPLFGMVMDRWGRLPVVYFGGVISLGTALGYGYVEAIGPGLLALRVTHGVAVGALFSVLFTIAADVVPPERRAQGLALFGVSGMLPLALGGLMGDWILGSASGDYGQLFSAIAACAFVGIVVSAPIPETRTAGGPKPAGFLAVATSPALRPLWIVGLAFAFAIAAFFIFLKTWVLELGQGSLGDVFAWYSGTAIALRVFLGHIPERFGLKRVLFPALVATCAGLLATGLAESAWTLNLAGVLCGLGHGYAFPIISALVVQRADPEQRGSAVAMFTALFDLGALVGGPSLGFIAREAGYPLMFSLAAGTCLAATVLFSWVDRGAEEGL